MGNRGTPNSSAGTVDGARVKALREALGWTQMELAYRAKLVQSKLSNIETNSPRAGLRVDSLRELCVALDCSADFLLGLSDTPKRNP